MLKNPISILGLTLIVTSVAVCSAEPQAVIAGGASQTRLVAAAHGELGLELHPARRRLVVLCADRPGAGGVSGRAAGRLGEHDRGRP